jgi:hypothetical protein
MVRILTYRGYNEITGAADTSEMGHQFVLSQTGRGEGHEQREVSERMKVIIQNINNPL